MPITADLNGKNLVLGRGKLYFGRYSDAQLAAGLTDATQPEGGFKYIGNTPEISLTSSEDTLDHFDSDEGVKTKDASVSLKVDRNGKFTTDNINSNNLGLLFLASGIGSIVQTSVTAAVYVAEKAQPDSFIQVGATAALPTGVRSISNVSVRKGAGFTTVVVATGNYQVDEVTGRIYILAGSTDIPAGTDIQVTYDTAAATRDQVISKNKPIYGALQYIANNPTGRNRDMLMPYVKLAPDGDYSLKGDDWQQISFTIEMLKKGSLEAVYIDGRPV